MLFRSIGSQGWEHLNGLQTSGQGREAGWCTFGESLDPPSAANRSVTARDSHRASLATTAQVHWRLPRGSLRLSLHGQHQPWPSTGSSSARGASAPGVASRAAWSRSSTVGVSARRSARFQLQQLTEGRGAPPVSCSHRPFHSAIPRRNDPTSPHTKPASAASEPAPEAPGESAAPTRPYVLGSYDFPASRS